MTSLQNQYFIHYLAPTLCGIKPANLFTLPLSDYSNAELINWKKKLKKLNLELVAFKNFETRITVFSYNPEWIMQILSDEKIQMYLYSKGYSKPDNISKTIKELINRLKTQKNFPHEVGIFLGYPFEDVTSFEQNNGHNCKYCGYWKSYSNPSIAKFYCEKYKQCSQLCKQWFEEGLTVPQIIKKYSEAADNVA